MSVGFSTHTTDLRRRRHRDDGDGSLPQRTTHARVADLCHDAEAGAWRLSWAPDHAEPDWPGHTYSPEDEDLPSDYPDPSDPDALVGWGTRHFG